MGAFFCVKVFALVSTQNRLCVSRALTRGLSVWASQKKNSLGQDPCDVVSMLEAACRGLGEWYIHMNTSWPRDPSEP